MVKYKTVREILTREWHAAGNVGPPTREYIAAWRLANPGYGGWSLTTRFRPGSMLPVKPDAIDADVDEAATEIPAAQERRRQHAEFMKGVRAESAAYQKKRNDQERALGNPPPFEEWWLEDTTPA